MKSERVCLEYSLAIVAVDLIFIAVSVLKTGNKRDKYAGIEPFHPVF